jgi:hypothetical protein
MNRLDALIEKQAKLTEELQTVENKTEFLKNELRSAEETVKEIKLQRDTASYKFVRSKMPDIIQKMAPKHKIPPDREISLTVDESNVTAQVPYTKDKHCSDEDPFNVLICPRCSLIHFQEIIDRTIAEYYS